MKTSIKTLALAVAVFAAASCTWDPIKHDILAVPETMVVTASADEIVLLEDNLQTEKLVFSWTPAREMSDEYYLTYQTKFDVVGNNFGSKTAIIQEFEAGENEFEVTFEQINNWATGSRWALPVNKEFDLEFRVIASWTGGPTFEIPEVKTVTVHVTPIKVIVFDADAMKVAGTAIAVPENLERTLENEKQFAWRDQLSVGTLQIPVDLDGQTYYIAPKDGGSAIKDAVSSEIIMQEEPFSWTVAKADTYRIVIDMATAKITIYSSENDLQPYHTGLWYHSGKEPNGWVEDEIVENLWLRGESAGWSASGRDLKLIQSLADPQVLVYSKAISGVSVGSGRTDFAIHSSFESTKEDGTKNPGTINNCYVFCPLKDISEMSGSDWNLGGMQAKTPYPMQAGAGAERGGYFRLPAGITFMVFDLRNMTFMYDIQ